jgi:hypothetical protein
MVRTQLRCILKEELGDPARGVGVTVGIVSEAAAVIKRLSSNLLKTQPSPRNHASRTGEGPDSRQFVGNPGDFSE